MFIKRIYTNIKIKDLSLIYFIKQFVDRRINNNTVVLLSWTITEKCYITKVNQLIRHKQYDFVLYNLLYYNLD